MEMVLDSKIKSWWVGVAAVMVGNDLHTLGWGVGEIQTKVISLKGNFRDHYSCLNKMLKNGEMKFKITNHKAVTGQNYLGFQFSLYVAVYY